MPHMAMHLISSTGHNRCMLWLINISSLKVDGESVNFLAVRESNLCCFMKKKVFWRQEFCMVKVKKKVPFRFCRREFMELELLSQFLFCFPIHFFLYVLLAHWRNSFAGRTKRRIFRKWSWCKNQPLLRRKRKEEKEINKNLTFLAILHLFYV